MKNNLNTNMSSDKKYEKYMNSLKYYKSMIKPENQKYFDEIKSLYINRQISKKVEVEKLLKKLTGRGTAAKSAIKLIETKYRSAPSVKGIRGEKKTFYVTAKFVLRTMWYKPDSPVMIDDLNADFLTDLYLHRYHRHTFSVYDDPIYYNSWINEDKKKKIPYRRIVMGRNGQHFAHLEYSQIYYEENFFNAEQLIRQEIIQEYTINDQYKRQDVIFFEDISYLKEAPTSGKDMKKMKMKQAQALKYPEFVGNIDDEEKNDGFCVFNNFLSTYPHINKKEFIKLCSEVEPVVNEADGISPEQLHHVCKQKDISHYSFDVSKKCFLKYVSKSRNYKALVYYAINNHMYHIKNQEIAYSLIKSAVDIETKINSIYFEEDEKTNIFTTGLEIKENIKIDELLSYNESCIVIYSHKHLNDQLVELMNNNIKPMVKRCKKTMVCYMMIQKSKEIKFYLFADENDHSQNITYKTVMALCKQHEIEFKNQTFPAVIKQIKDQHIQEKNKRQEFTREFKIEFYKNNSRCNNKECNIILKKGDREIDHIKPIYKGGHPTDINNLQALCKECHYDKTQDDLEEENVKISKTHSSFSNSVGKVMDSNLNKSWAFVDRGLSSFHFDDDDDEDDGPITGDIDEWLIVQAEKNKDKIKKVIKSSNIDINGCRRNLLRFNKHDFPLFTVLDQFEIYNGQTSPGKYYVECDNYMPLRGNGFYFYPTIKYCLENNIIQSSDIKYCLLSSLTTPHDYFNDFIDYCVKNIKDYKLAINSLIGSFAVNKESKFWRSLIITEDVNEAHHYFYNNNGCFIDVKQSERCLFYHVFQESNSFNVETERIIYDMIVELEALELHKLETIIQTKGGKVTEYKTDCIRFDYIDDFPFTMLDNKNIDGYFYPDGEPMYKIEIKGELLKDMLGGYKRTETFEYKKKDFNIINDVEDNDFKPLIEKIINCNGCSIEGVAGSGKSTLINNLFNEIKSKGMDCTLLTPTNLSSIVINGITLDKFHKKMRSVEILQNLVKDYIIIDEVSMMKELFYKMLTVIKTYKPSTKIILVGHDLQFSPVKDRIGNRRTEYYFNSDVFNELVDSNKLILTKCRRSDDRHYKNCCDVNNVNINDYGSKIAEYNICYTNNKRIQINKNLMDRAKNKNIVSKQIELELEKNPYSKKSQKVYLTIGTPVIAIKNKKEIDLINSEMFTIKEINKNESIITVVSKNEKTLEIPFDKFQRWFHLAYCITAHKSQGQTINKPYTIHDWYLMDKTCKYVSLSRASNYDYVNIL